MASHYKYTKKWRRNNPHAHAEEKKRNYRQTQNAKNSHKQWTNEHTAMIIDPNRPSDRKLSEVIGRSVQAIQVRRSILLTPLKVDGEGD